MTSDLLSSVAKEGTMYRKILVGYDDSEQARDALTLGKQLADATGADLVVAGVLPCDPVRHAASSWFHDAAAEFAGKIEDAARSVGAEPAAVPSSSPAHGLYELAEEIGADLILVGSARHGRIGQIVAGSTGVSLRRGSPCAVGIAPRGYASRGRSAPSPLIVTPRAMHRTAWHEPVVVETAS
jgi:nucleotide-binding universal stress UspA family protein